jgi:hypothetical protein
MIFVEDIFVDQRKENVVLYGERLVTVTKVHSFLVLTGYYR